MAKLHSSQTNLFVRIEVAQNAGLRHVEVINGDEAFYPQPMKDYGEWLKSFIQSYFEPGGCRAPPSNSKVCESECMSQLSNL